MPAVKVPRPGRKTFLGALPLMILFLTGAYLLQWYAVAGMAEDRLAAWAEERRAAGGSVSYGETTLEGFPFWVGLVVPDLNLGAPDKGGGLNWKAERVMIELSPLSPARIRLHLDGAHRISAVGRNVAMPFALGADVAAGTLDLAEGEGLIPDADLRLRDTTLHDLLAAGPVTVAHFTARLRPITGAEASGGGGQPATAALTVDLRHAALPDTPTLPLGPELEEITLDARLMGRLPATSRLDRALTQWQENDGTVEVQRLRLAWPPLAANARGTLALDDRLQPTGSLTARAEGFFRALETMAEANLLRRRDVSMAKVVLGMLARRQKDGRPVISLPITLQNRALYAGPVELTGLPTVRWTTRPDLVEPGATFGPAR